MSQIEQKQIAQEALTKAGLSVLFKKEQIQVSLGGALRRRVGQFSIFDFQEAIGDGDLASVASVARGIYAALNTPILSKSDTPISFREAAAVISPSLESGRFAAGVGLLSDEKPYLLPFFDGMKCAYFIEQNTGNKLLNVSDVTRWNMHSERIEKAAASILYHRTAYWREPESISLDDITLIRYKIGDGFDAARATILEELDFHRWRAGFYFAVPDSDTLWITKKHELNEKEQFLLQKRVENAFNQAEAPLSRALYRVHNQEISRA